MGADNMKRIFIVLLVLSLAIPIASAADPYDGFTPTSINGSAPLIISFWDISYDYPTSWMWNYTDVTGADVPITMGISQNLTYTFNVAGNNSIQLITTSAFGTNVSPANTVFVNVTGPAGIPAADFSVDDNNVPAGTVVHFTDLSTNVPTSWLWQFQSYGNPIEWTTMSTDQNPSFTTAYINNLGIDPGVYNIRLTATNAAGSDTETKYGFLTATEAPESPIASFTPTGTLEDTIYVIRINTNSTIYFSDTSTAGTPISWNWSFGSLLGTLYSSEQNPSFEYNTTTANKDYPYPVTLIATNAAGSSSATKYVIMSDPPVTPIVRYDVTTDTEGYDVTHGTPDTQRIGVYNGFDPAVDHTVLFDDKSYNSPTSLSWTIDAGNGSTYNYFTDNFEFDYGYAEPGNYSVIHSATNDAGTDSLTMLTLVNVVDTIPPASISSITNVTGPTQIKWNWTNPTTSDYHHVQVYKDGVFIENVTGNGTTWSGLTPLTLYSIGTRAVDTAGNVNATWVNSSSTTIGSTWEYTTCGATYWTAPEGVWNVTLEMIAAGGSGHPAYTSTGYYYGGWGGKAGEKVTYPKVEVIPGTNYTLVVGCKGASATYGTDSNAGTYSSAFGTTVSGGLGGLAKVTGDDDTSVGGDGENGLGTTRYAVNGTTTALGAGGVSGLGRGASGGGSAANTTASPLGTGGAGADGYINITVFGYASVNLPDFSADMATGVPGTLIHFNDESVINNGAGLAYNWSFGDGTYSSVAGDTQHVFSYTGSYDVSLTLTSSDGTSTETKYAYINIVTEPPVVSPYFPNTVRFTVMNYLGSNVVGATVNATYVQSTLPGGIDFLESAYHIDSETAAAMMSSNIVMSGQTGDDGGIVFSMHPSLQYRITANSSQGNISVLVYPKETDYNLWLPAPNISSVYRDINVTLTFSEPNVTAISMGAMYQDFTGATSSLLFYVNKSDGTPVYSQTSTPGTTKVIFNKTIANVRGEMYYWGIRGTRTGGNVSLDQGVTAKGPNGVLVDLRLPNTMYYPWISIFLLFMITSLASKNNIRFIAIILPLMAAMFWWFGWLTGSYLSSVIPLTGLIGAIYYMKGSLRENYGVGGPGSMLINIVVFLLIFQMTIGFIDELGVFDKSTFMADPTTSFSNVDLTDVQNGVQNFGGINDPLQSTSAIGTVAWATVKIAMKMIGSALLISATLTEMFPYVPAAFFVIIQVLVYIIYILFIIKLFWKAGSEVDL